MYKLNFMKVFLPCLIILAIFVLLPVFPETEYIYPVYAQDSTTSATTPRKPLEKRIEKIEARKDAAIERLDAKKDAVMARLDARKERIATKTAALKTRLLAFRDKKKAQRVERVNENLDKINLRRTESMTKHLGQMEDILERIQDRINEGSATGDLSPAQTAVDTAKSAIETAKAAVEAQAEKEYTIVVNTETTVKTDAQTQRDALHTDLKATHDLVVAARKAVANAISTTVSTLKGLSSGQ